MAGIFFFLVIFMMKTNLPGFFPNLYKMKLLALVFLPMFAFAQPKLDTVPLLSGKLSILVPDGLAPMSEEMWTAKYHKTDRPMFVLSDKDGEINFIADRTGQPANEGQLTAFKDFQLRGLKERRPDVTILDEGLKTVNGHKVAYFKFISQAIDQKVFNHYFFAVVDGKILFCTFNCIEKLQSRWASVADQIMSSLRIR